MHSTVWEAYFKLCFMCRYQMVSIGETLHRLRLELYTTTALLSIFIHFSTLHIWYVTCITTTHHFSLLTRFT